jgi:hypothetical protein
VTDDLIRHKGALHLSHNSNFNEQPGRQPLKVIRLATNRSRNAVHATACQPSKDQSNKALNLCTAPQGVNKLFEEKMAATV